MQDISKLCVDHLRVFLKDDYNIKLKASHAHELVAAFFGYRSKAALLADMTAPINNLSQAAIIVLEHTSMLDQRRQDLQGLSSDLPDNHILKEKIYSILETEKLILRKKWQTFVDLAQFLADERLRQGIMYRIASAPLYEDVKIKATNTGMVLTVSRSYRISKEKAFFSIESKSDITIIIKFPRLAGHIGYGKPEISKNTDANLGVQL